MHHENQIEDALWKADWALNNINDHLDEMLSRTQDHHMKWNLAQAKAAIKIVQGDVSEARSYLKLPRWRRIYMKIVRK